MPTIDIGFWQHHLRHDAKPHPPTERRSMKQHLALRWCLLAIGIVVMAAGIVIVTKSATGNTPISSTGYVLSVAFPSVSYGVFMFFWNILLLIGQVIILRRRFQPLALLQIPISVLFSLSIDAFASLLSWFTPSNYAESLGMLALGILTLAAGVSFTVVANVAMNCGEALVATPRSDSISAASSSPARFRLSPWEM